MTVDVPLPRPSDSGLYVDLDALRDGNELDDLFSLLSNCRRRLIVYHLYASSGTAELGELSRRIAAYESGDSVDEIDRERYHSVYITLYQNHVPRLESAGVVVYDDDAGTVALTSRARRAAVHRPRPAAGRRWHAHYAAVGVVTALLVGVLALPTVPAPTVAWTALTLVGATVLCAVAFLQYREDDRSRSPNLLHLQRLV